LEGSRDPDLRQCIHSRGAGLAGTSRGFGAAFGLRWGSADGIYFVAGLERLAASAAALAEAWSRLVEIIRAKPSPPCAVSARAKYSSAICIVEADVWSSSPAPIHPPSCSCADLRICPTISASNCPAASLIFCGLSLCEDASTPVGSPAVVNTPEMRESAMGV